MFKISVSISAGAGRVVRWCWVNFQCRGGGVVRWSWVNFQCRGVLQFGITVGQGPTALAVGAGGGCLDIFTLIYPFFPLSPSLWETARYGLKYCLKGLLNPKPTNQPSSAGASYNFDYCRARAYCACSRCGWGWFGHFYSHLSFLLFLPLFGRWPDID